MRINYILLAYLGAFFTCLGNQQTVAQTPDPGLMGTYAVTKAQYNLGDLAWKAPSFPDSLEVRGSVHYPTTLTGGPFPVLFWLHGRHETCYQTSDPTNTSSDWPCLTGWQSIVSYEGYDYAARTMASHGYIVISISCNAINATDAGVADAGMQGRAELMQHHMDLWNTWNTVGGGPFGALFIGKLNMKNIGTMGHSRGGEGAIDNALYNRSLGSPYGIKAVLTLAPVDFHRHVLNGIPLMNVAPYCDGDVNAISGVHFYDDARYVDTTDEMPKHAVLMLGANHNYYNTVWTPGSYIAGGVDDWSYTGGPGDPQCGPSMAPRFDTTKQKAAFNAYAAAFYRVYLGHETIFSPILEVKDIVPPASSLLDSTNVFLSYHAGKSDRLDINRTDLVSNDATNTLNDTVTETGLVSYGVCDGGFAMPLCGVSPTARKEPHRGNSTTIGLAQMALRWDDTLAWYQNLLPTAYQDLTPWQSLVFRAAINFKESPAGKARDFTVQLIDSAGNTASQAVSAHSHAMFFQPGTQANDLPKVMFNTINLPLSGFTGVNLAKIRKVKFKFNRSDTGSILISDLAFIVQDCGNINAAFHDSLGTKYKEFFINQSTGNKGDSIVYYWKFGDPASGVRDTSTQKNPFHIYTTHGTYTACLYVTGYRKNGFICKDSFCVTISLVNDGVPSIAADRINITPNPAKDFLHITGAEPADILKLVNLYGQVVFTTTINQPDIYLPQNLPTGIYYAIVSTTTGNVYRKIFVSR